MEIKTNDPSLYHKGTNGKAILILHGFTAEVARTDIIFKYFCGKGYTVSRPVLAGHSGVEAEDKLVLMNCGPKEWLSEARAWLEYLATVSEEIFIIGISFGGNLAVSLCSEGHEKIKGVVLMEMPIFFTPRMAFVIKFLQPIAERIGVDFIKKSGYLYRKRYNRQDDRGTFTFIPVKAVGKIRSFIEQRTKEDLSKINIPTLIFHAEKSDLLNNRRNAKYIYDRIASKHKKIHYMPIDNHDLSLLDEEGKIIMMEQVHNFITKL